MVTFYESAFGIVLWGILAVCCVTARITLSQGPENVIIREGETATMACTVTGRKGRDTVRWYRVSSAGVSTAISSNQDIEPGAAPAAGAYSITENRRNGEYNLHITSANRRDSGEYRCGFETGPRNDVTSEGAELRVVVPPDVISPRCSIIHDDSSSSASTPRYYMAGDTVQMRCISSGGVPPARLRWKRGDTYLTQEITGMATLEKVLEITDLDEEFTCYAESVALDTPRSCSLIPLRRPPSVRISPESASIPVGGGITFACEAEGAVPSDSILYRWFVNGNEISDSGRQHFRVSDDTKSLTMQRIRESDDGAVVRCELQLGVGSLGQAEASVSVTGVQRTSNVQTTVTIPTISSPSSSSSSASSSRSSPSPVTSTVTVAKTKPVTSTVTVAKTNPTVTGSMTHGMPTELIVVSAVAGVAIGSLAIILVVYLFKKHRKRQARKASRQNRQPPGSTSISQPAMAVQPVRQVINGVDQSEDGYTLLSKPNNYEGGDRAKASTSGVYEMVGNNAVSKPDSADNDLYWECDNPYSKDHGKIQPMNASNPIYLEIIQ